MPKNRLLLALRAALPLLCVTGALTCMSAAARDDAATRREAPPASLVAHPVVAFHRGQDANLLPPSAKAPSASSSTPGAAPASQGSAALREYREDVDPSHAAVASYSD